MMRTNRAVAFRALPLFVIAIVVAAMFGSVVLTQNAFVQAETQASDQATISKGELDMVRAVEKARIIAIEKVYHTVVAIYGMTRQGGGSGVIYDPEGYALTNYHVVAGAGPQGWAGLADGKLYKWKLIGMDPGGDLAIIKLEGKDKFDFAELADSDSVRPGDFAMAMGNPFILAEDQTPTVTLGIVSGTNRYQPGTGATGTMLEYGNCIQIDSSINPGNSGGPLFNMKGQVIGINGRGSFEERGRVNVGVGYAISINQAKTFIPELLSTKTAMHGTLEVHFERRGDREVVCSQINLDSPIGKAGMVLSDELIRFDGHEIKTAHQFKNIIATLPAGWPVEVVWRHEDEVKSAWVRLNALDYPKPKKRPQPKIKPKLPAKPAPNAPKTDDEKKIDRLDGLIKTLKNAAAKEADAAKKKKLQERISQTQKAVDGLQKKVDAAKKKASPKKPAPKRPAIPVRPGKPQLKMDFGKVSNAKLNREEAIRVIKQNQQFAGAKHYRDLAGAMLRQTISGNQGQAINLSSVVSKDGRFRVEMLPDAKATNGKVLMVWDGKQFYHTDAEGKVNVLTGNAAWKNDSVAFITLINSLSSDSFEKQFKRIEHQGTGKANGKRASRIFVEDHHGNFFVLWFSLLSEDQARFETRLLKFSRADKDGKPNVLASQWSDFRMVEPGMTIAFSGRDTSGIEEKTLMEQTINAYVPLKKLPENAFVIPSKP
jgi:serine protease Do